MFFRNLIFALLIFGASTTLYGQICTLDIGGENTKTMTEVFQLNEVQLAVLDSLRTDLAAKTGKIEAEIEKLMAQHPQSTEEELIKLAEKYKVLQQKMVKASYESDKKLLEQFNPKQYERYLQLCKAAIRMPITVEPKIYPVEPD